MHPTDRAQRPPACSPRQHAAASRLPAAVPRMAAVRATVPGAFVMDTGAAAVLGALGDPAVAHAAAEAGTILVDVGNLHTFAVLVARRRLFGKN